MHIRVPVVLAICGAGLLAGCDGRRPSSETFNWKGPVSADSWLRLRNTSGDFTVTEGTGDSATITLDVERSSSYAPPAQIKVVSTGDGVLACVLFGNGGTCSEGQYKSGQAWTKHFLPFFRGETKVSGNITLPKGVKLDVESVNGDVSVNAASRDLIVRTVNGDISIDESFGPLSLHTTNGDIDAGVRAVGGQVNVETTNGDVSLTMPTTLNAVLNMSTVNGELDLGFSGNFSKHTKKSIMATLGQGGATIGIETVNGDISVKPVGSP